jgi:type IV pilus assembly protein PilO
MAGLPTNQRDQTLLLLAVLGVVGAGANWYLVFAPKQEALAIVATRVDSMDAGVQRAKALLASGGSEKTIRKEVERMRANLNLMRTLVPGSNEVPDLLEQVSITARRVGLEINTIMPEPRIEGEQFDTYRYRLRVTGSYHEIGELLTGIASMPRIIAPIGLQLTPSATPTSRNAGTPDRVMLVASFVIQTYAVKTSVSETGADGQRRKPGKKG